MLLERLGFFAIVDGLRLCPYVIDGSKEVAMAPIQEASELCKTHQAYRGPGANSL